MKSIRTLQQEAAEDIFFGQVVTIWARWFLILVGTVLILWSTDETDKLVFGILPILALMAMNFFLHARYLIEKPVNQVLLMITSLLDLMIITVFVALWEPRGLENQFFVFYYPVVLSVGFVFPRSIATGYTASAIIAYTAVCYVIDPAFVTEVADQKLLVARLITVAAMGGLGTYYWRIQRDRRRSAVSRS